jgi:hypothetical protein
MRIRRSFGISFARGWIATDAARNGSSAPSLAVADTDIEDPALKLVYEESVRGWSLQSSVLDEIRTRTGILLSATSISSALLGSADLTKHETFRTMTYLAVGAFCLSLLLCVYVLRPTRGWTFSHTSRGLLDAYVDKGKSLDSMHRELALAADGYRDVNDKKIKRQFRAFRWASLALGASIVFWLIDLN